MSVHVPYEINTTVKGTRTSVVSIGVTRGKKENIIVRRVVSESGKFIIRRIKAGHRSSKLPKELSQERAKSSRRVIWPRQISSCIMNAPLKKGKENNSHDTI